MSTHLRRVFATRKSNETRPQRIHSRPRLLTLEDRCTPATFTVTSVGDSGVGTLRQAIILANAAPGADIIDFDSEPGGAFHTPQTIMVSAALGQLSVNSDLVITGTGASNLTIDATGSGGRVFSISGPDRIAVTLSGMTITGGSVNGDGGGINYDNENLTLDGVVLTGNSATGTENSGGGISDIVGGILTVRNSTISGNTTSGRGGGIYFFNGGTLLLENSTVSGNTAAEANGGGGMYFFGIVDAAGVAIRNSTIAGNTAPSGGGIALRTITGTIQIQNSTIALNTSTTVVTGVGLGGGGIALESGTNPVLTLTNSIVSGNSSSPANGRSDIAVSATATVNGYYCSIFDSDGFTLSGVSTNNRPFEEDPKLDPNGLASNGGPTKTISLQADSPVFDNGPSIQAGVPFDQRGSPFQRVRGGASDMGAFEIQVIAPPSVQSILVNGSNAAQRSRVTSISVTFNTVVTFATTPEAAFSLVRQTDQAPVNFTCTVSVNGAAQSVVVLSGFADGTPGITQFGSLADGRYILTVLAFQVRAGPAPLPSDFVFSDNNGLYRLFGDVSGGDRRVDIADFGLFSLAYLSPANFNPAFDFNGDGRVDITDFGQFSIRYFTSLP